MLFGLNLDFGFCRFISPAPAQKSSHQLLQLHTMKTFISLYLRGEKGFVMFLSQFFH